MNVLISSFFFSESLQNDIGYSQLSQGFFTLGSDLRTKFELFVNYHPKKFSSMLIYIHGQTNAFFLIYIVEIYDISQHLEPSDFHGTNYQKKLNSLGIFSIMSIVLPIAFNVLSTAWLLQIVSSGNRYYHLKHVKYILERTRANFDHVDPQLPFPTIGYEQYILWSFDSCLYLTAIGGKS